MQDLADDGTMLRGERWAIATQLAEETGIGAGHFLTDNSLMVGASGAIMGVLVSFGMFFPESRRASFHACAVCLEYHASVSSSSLCFFTISAAVLR